MKCKYCNTINEDDAVFCKKCGRELPHTYQYFPEDKLCKNGLRNVCRECSNHYKNFLPDDYQIIITDTGFNEMLNHKKYKLIKL